MSAADEYVPPLGDVDPSQGETNPFHEGRSRTLDGEAFVFGASAKAVPVWGSATAPLWAAGEGLMIAGPDGVGKTTVMQQLALARIGLRSDLFGAPVIPTDRQVLYLALDRPRQIARSFRRMVDQADRATLRERLTIWSGPLEEDIGTEKGEFLISSLAADHNAGTVFVDCLGDAAVNLTDDGVGGRVKRAFNRVTETGVELATGHHQRKANSDNRKPNKLADVYGSRWLTAGMGSVLMLWGEAGDVVVELTHLKQPLEPVGPLTLLHNHERGQTTAEVPETIEDLVAHARRSGLTASDAARQLYGSDDRSAVERARRKLEKLTTRDGYTRRDDEDGTARYYASRLEAA